jgi:hypothetical protein
MSQDQTMRRLAHSKSGKDAGAESDVWVWGVIFTAAALTALCVATLFGVAAGSP